MIQNDLTLRLYLPPVCKIRGILIEQNICSPISDPDPGGNEDVGYEDWQL